MITLAVLGMLIMIALPNIAAWLQNTQIRTSAEGMQAGLQLARAEALKRNATVRFQLVDTLTSACAVSATGSNWVVSLDDASGLCDTDASETVAPRIIQKRSARKARRMRRLRATGGSSVVFNGLGRAAAGSHHARSTSRNPATAHARPRPATSRCAACALPSTPAARSACAIRRSTADLTDPRRAAEDAMRIARIAEQA